MRELCSERREKVTEIDVQRHPVALQHQTSRLDVERGYRVFLLREPDQEELVLGVAQKSLIQLLASFLVSEEFYAKLHLNAAGVFVDVVLLTPLDGELLDWAVASVAPDTMRVDQAIDRFSVVRALLDDVRVMDMISIIDDQRMPYIAALKIALADLAHAAATIAASNLFDTEYYRAQLPVEARVASPALHYTLLGESLGFAASPGFRAKSYANVNPDVAATTLNRLLHYETWGRQEGRRRHYWLSDHVLPPLTAPDARPTVLLLLHAASYTGAPILGWNLVRALDERCRIVVVLRHGGALEGALREVSSVVVSPPPYEATLDPSEMDAFAKRLVAVYRPIYAIANSVETGSIAIALRDHNIPIVALVHEFWPGAPTTARSDFYASCAALVFPARVVERSSLQAFRETWLQNRFILPQGACAVPPFDPAVAPALFGAPFRTGYDPQPTLRALLADGQQGKGPFTVIGLGAVEMRKGLDLFIAAATVMKAKYPNIAVRFIWIGTWEHAIGSQYAMLLEEQCRRSELGDRLHFFPTVDNLEPVYARADALFLSSRLDPLPNITIDAAFRGVPVICFDRASGTAELLATDSTTAMLVVPHLDSGAAADQIAVLATNPVFQSSCSAAVRQLAQRSFNMDLYALALDVLGHAAAQKFENAKIDQVLIEQADAVDLAIYVLPDDPAKTAEMTPAATYIGRTKHINFASPPALGAILRRPMAGFHPFIYGTEAPDFPHDGSRDPLAHYLERGQPPGRWTHPVLRPDIGGETGEQPQAASLTKLPMIALHGHFHIWEDIGDFIAALAVNHLRADLFLTTTSMESATALRHATSNYSKGNVVVEITPNVGDDIYPFIEVLRTHIQGQYALTGHFHGTSDAHKAGSASMYDLIQRDALWGHLLGPTHRVGDAIVEALQNDKKLGLVFPENANLIGGEKNGDSAAALARHFGLRAPLAAHIESLPGTMFWARTAALEALIDAALCEDEMPVKRLSDDKTIFHALERMLPLLCEDAGYTYATTYVPQLRW
jgi:glycosyltransferase involved in cell wall biosynthesis